MKDKHISLLLTSFLILFLELVLIRWVPAYIRYLSYFTNTILIASFLGVGIGCLNSKRKENFLSVFLILLAFFVVAVNVLKLQINFPTEQVLFLWSSWQAKTTEPFILLPLVFISVVVIFASLGQSLGRLLKEFKPLHAYSLDILGSISGIVVFSIISFYGSNPVLWFAIIGIVYLYLIRYHSLFLLNILILGLIIFYVGIMDKGNRWSPYYRINILRMSQTGWTIDVNSITHQFVETYENQGELYKIIYDQFKDNKFADLLIIGAGAGADAAIALKNEVKNIDAVEIDAEIIDIGKEYHPALPYNDPKVHIYIDDARSFLERTNKQYDVIIYALTDSLTLTSSFSNLRLESFLYTVDSFATAKKRLKDNGMIVLYSYYRKEWLIDKLASMLGNVFPKEQIWVKKMGGGYQAAVIMAGPRVLTVKADKASPWVKGQDQDYHLSTDDWPFVYLKKHSFPRIYIKALLVIMAVSVFLIWLSVRKTLMTVFSTSNLGFFFLGAAFLLLETRSIINFNLLFGSTWIVNSLVFIGILTSVLLANLLVQKTKIKKKFYPVLFRKEQTCLFHKEQTCLYFLLFSMLVVNYLTPLSKFLIFPPFWRYGLASLMIFSPIFLANLIFSTFFKDTKTPSFSFGANLSGAFVGGLFEYFSMLIGYKNLLLFVALFYLLAFYFSKTNRRKTFL